MARTLWGPLTRLGFAVAIATCVLDQASKLWLLKVYDLAAKGATHIAPFVDLVLTWNTGISYGWFQNEGPFGQVVLLLIKALAVTLLWLWLTRATSRLSAISLGLIIGGAVGNAIDRILHEGVVDFVQLYAQTAAWRFNWYVFNLADVAIVAGVIGLLYESLTRDSAPKAP